MACSPHFAQGRRARDFRLSLCRHARESWHPGQATKPTALDSRFRGNDETRMKQRRTRFPCRFTGEFYLTLCWKNIRQTEAASATGDPDRDSRLQPLYGLDGIGPDGEGIEIMVADGAGRAPGREIAQPAHLRDLGRNLLAVDTLDQHQRRADAQPPQFVLPDVEIEPGLA